MLLKLNLVQSDNLAALVEDEESCAGGTLVNGTDEGCGSRGRHVFGAGLRRTFRFARSKREDGREHPRRNSSNGAETRL